MSRVTDGDTIRVIVDGEDVPVRYIGIDTPEPDDPDPAVKAMADRATAANAALVEGRSVILERDVSETDQFDRWLRDVWVEGEDGELLHVGLELVRGGFAQVSTFPPDVKYADLLVETQAAARVAQVGLWAPVPTPTPEPTPIRFADSDLVFVDSEERTRFEGGVGDYTWSNLVVEGDRMTVRWDVTAGAAACRLAWEVQAVDGTGFNSTVRVDAGDREEDNRRYDVDFTEVAFVASSTCESWVMTMQTRAPAPDADCDDSYVGVCIPPYPPDLDCGEIPFRDFEVVGSDPHGFDREGDGLGCES